MNFEVLTHLKRVRALRYLVFKFFLKPKHIKYMNLFNDLS